MPANISNESTLANNAANADRALQAAPSVISKTETAPDEPIAGMRLDMNEILGLKRS
ncbi:MAG: hypothetical protein ABI852_20500 [Gemmatimonadaceae bacterium]